MIKWRGPGCAWQAALIMLALPVGVRSADWTISPSLRLREGYSNNIDLSPAGQERGDFSSEVTPGISITGNGPRLKLRLDYSLQGQAYQREPDRVNQQLAANAHGELLQDWLFFDAHSSINRQNISAFGPQISDTSQISANSTEVRSLSLYPYLQHYFHGWATAQLRYEYDRVSGGGLLDTRSDDATFTLNGDNGGHGWNWNASYDRQDIKDSTLAPVTMSNAGLTLSIPVSGSLGWYGSGGDESSDYHGVAADAGGRYWSSGLNWTPSPRTSVNASVGHHYYGKTYGLDAQYRTRATFTELSYGVGITNTQAQIVALAPNDVGNFLYQLWATNIPDPTQRLQTINTFLLLSQLLGPNAGVVHYFSHRYYLQKQWNLSTAYSSAKSTFALGLTSSGRTALTSSAIDSMLLGSSEIALNDRTRQNGANAGWSWRMSPHNTCNLGATAGSVDSISTGRRDINGTLSLGLTHQHSRKITSIFDLHRTRHSSTAGGGYHEYGASAALVVVF